MEKSHILLVHRDADRAGLEARRSEIPLVNHPLVGIVPVRMTEAWLLLDESAIRRAAQNPNGRGPLELPNAKKLESIPDPKAHLQELILRASEITSPRRMRRSKRDLPRAQHVLAQEITDFGVLDGLPAFRAFVTEFDEALNEIGPSPLAE